MKGFVKLVYTRVIDASSSSSWDKRVFDSTHREFFMQAQQFDQKGEHKTYREILKAIPKAENINYLVSTAAVGYLKELDGLFPEVLNTLGKPCIPFRNFQFELIQSHTTNKSLHRVDIHFYSERLLWIDTIDGHFIFAAETDYEKLQQGHEVDTHSVVFPAGAGVASIQMPKTA